MEKSVQNQIFELCVNQKDKKGNQRFFNIIPNIFFFDWESDMLVMDNQDRILEFEIKTSRKDLINDFSNKKAKHSSLENRKGKIPNFFYFVVAEGEYMQEDIPQYAGLYAYRQYNCKERGEVVELFLQKVAPILSYATFGLQDTRSMLQSVYFKYWRERINKNLFQKINNT